MLLEFTRDTYNAKPCVELHEVHKVLDGHLRSDGEEVTAEMFPNAAQN